jgi:HEPN domain-containing protein
MTPSIEEAHRLLRLAERDLQTYRILAAHPDASLAAACFHAQQSVEKALKAVLTAHGATFPRTHNLEELGLLVAGIGISLPVPAQQFSFQTHARRLLA